jgi:nucleoid-associated protein YgaU
MFCIMALEHMFGGGDVMLTRRRKGNRRIRIILGVLALTLLLGLAWNSLAMAQAEPPLVYKVVVKPGETLWSIAADYCQGEDPRPLIYAIRKTNQLDSADIFPGQVIVIPEDYRRL